MASREIKTPHEFRSDPLLITMKKYAHRCTWIQGRADKFLAPIPTCAGMVPPKKRQADRAALNKDSPA